MLQYSNGMIDVLNQIPTSFSRYVRSPNESAEAWPIKIILLYFNFLFYVLQCFYTKTSIIMIQIKILMVDLSVKTSCVGIVLKRETILKKEHHHGSAKRQVQWHGYCNKQLPIPGNLSAMGCSRAATKDFIQFCQSPKKKII